MHLRKIPQPRLHKPSGQLRVRHQGRDLYFGPFDDPASHEKFEQWRAELLVRNVLPGSATKPEGPGATINFVLLAYLEYAEVYYRKDGKPGPEFTAMKAVARPIKDLYGSLPATQFGPLALRA